MGDGNPETPTGMSDADKALMAIAVTVLSLVLFIGCKRPSIGPPSGPTPIPTPAPTPPPQILDGPLRVQGGRFVDIAGRPILVTGHVACCEGPDVHGWPWISEAALRASAEAGGNYAHLRNGPNAGGEGPQYDGYVKVGSRYDLDQFNQPFFDRLGERVSYAGSLGIKSELDVLDAWVFKHAADELSVFLPQNNIQDFDGGDCGALSSPPKDRHRAWITKLVEETGRYDSVLYHVGNETFDCHTSLAWEEGVAKAIRQAEARFGYPRHLIGTNSQDSRIQRSSAFDYITLHQHEAAGPMFGKPVLINEYNPGLSPDELEKQLRIAKAKAQGFAFWCSDCTPAEYTESLKRIKKVQSEP